MIFVLAAMISLSLVAFLLIVGVVLHRMSAKRAFHEMVAFVCPFCSRPMGLKAIVDGRDYTPFDVLWDLQGKLVHCHPICRSVKCDQCGNCCVIRLNREGEHFGPRLSLENGEQIARVKAMSPEQVIEMKTWLAEQKATRISRDT